MAGSRRSSRKPARECARNFYADSVEESERVAMEAARDVEGLDDEIALLRARLRKALEERPEDAKLMLEGIELLVKAVSARYRLSSQAKQDLSESIVGVLRGIGGALYPEGFADV